MKKKIVTGVCMAVVSLVLLSKPIQAKTIYDKNDCPTGEHIVKEETISCTHDPNQANAWIEAKPDSSMAPDFLMTNESDFLKFCTAKTEGKQPFEVKMQVQPEEIIGATYDKTLSAKKVVAVINGDAGNAWEIAHPSTKEHENHEIVANYACLRYGFVWCPKSRRWECVIGQHTYLYDAKLGKDVDHETNYFPEHTVKAYETQPNRYEIRYMPNGGSGKTQNQKAVYGQNLKLKGNLFQRKNYCFMGWSEHADGSGKRYEAGQNVSNLTKEHKGVVTLYAQWERIYTVQYRLHAGNRQGTVPKKQKKVGKETLKLTLDTPSVTEEGYQNIYRFLGWSETADGSSGIWKEQTYSREADLTLYAQWDTSYQVQYDGNGAQAGTPCTDTVRSIGETYTLQKNQTSTKFKRTATYEDTKKTVSCKFLGWSLKQDYAQAVQGSNLLKGGKTFKNGGILKQAIKENLISFKKKQVIIKVYAVWDQAPQLTAADRYFTLEEAQKGAITENELRKCVAATDKEDGKFEGDQIVLQDYQMQDFTALEHEAVMSMTYFVTDQVGNTAKVRKKIYIVDQRADQKGEKARETLQKIRFLPDTYDNECIDALFTERSLWKCDEQYCESLKKTLQNHKVEQETLPGSSKKRPGSGRWLKEAEKTWHFSAEEIEEWKK